MLTDQELLALYDAEMRIDPPLDGGHMRKLSGLVVFEAGPNSHHGGWVLYTHLAEHELDVAIQSQIEHFRALGRSFEWKVFDHDTPANLKERLRAYGFTPDEPEALAILDLEEAPEVLWQPVPEAVRRVTQPAEIDLIVEILECVWDEPRGRLGEALKSDLIQSPHTISLFLAYVDDQPASAAWMYYHPGKQFADLFGGSTLEQFRGRGLYTALVAARAQEARGRGVRFLTVDASPMSRPILEKLGFRVLLYSQPFVWEPR